MAYRYIVFLLFAFVLGILFIAKGDFSTWKPIFYTDTVQEKGHAGLLLPGLWPCLVLLLFILLEGPQQHGVCLRDILFRVSSATQQPWAHLNVCLAFPWQQSDSARSASSSREM